MSMEFSQRLDPEMQIAHLQEQVTQIEMDLVRVREWVTGNGDPTKGLLWLAADLSRLIATQSKLTEANRQTAIEEHRAMVDGLSRHSDDPAAHYTRRPWAWQQRLLYDTARQAVSIILAAVLFLVLLGTQSWVRCVVAGGC